MFSLAFLKRVGEEAAVAGLVAFGALMVADEAGFTTAAALAGLQAAARAVYGVFVKNIGNEGVPSATRVD